MKELTECRRPTTNSNTPESRKLKWDPSRHALLHALDLRWNGQIGYNCTKDLIADLILLNTMIGVTMKNIIAVGNIRK